MTDKDPKPRLPDQATMMEAWQMLMSLQQAGSVRTNPVGVAREAISFTLITGFLGSGKTTLVNNLLTESHGMRIAIILNDFGAVNIDAGLIEKSSSDSISLENGCVCCTLTNGLLGAVADLVGRESPPDHIILEASGIAEPYAVIQAALANPALRLNGIVCIVDADRLSEDLETSSLEPIIRRQARASDLIIVNKTDVAGPDKIAKVRDWLQHTHPQARMIMTAYGKVPAVVVVGVPVKAAFEAEAFAGSHSDIFQSITFTSDLPLDDRRLRNLLDNLPPGVLRVKGFIRLISSPGDYSILQSTVSRWSITKEQEGKARMRSEIVIIGIRGEFDPSLVAMSFAACELRAHSSRQ